MWIAGQLDINSYHFPFSFTDSSHNKLLTATPAQVLKNIIKPERAELTAQLENLDKDEVI